MWVLWAVYQHTTAATKTQPTAGVRDPMMDPVYQGDVPEKQHFYVYDENDAETVYADEAKTAKYVVFDGCLFWLTENEAKNITA